MDKATRKAQIQAIYNAEPVAKKATRLLYQGEAREFDIYLVPIEFLAYNRENGRIGSLVKSYEREHAPLDENNPNDANIIAEFLYNSSELRNQKTMKDLEMNGQLEPGIITMDGVIVDGNRRASLLRRIYNDTSKPQTVRDRCAYFRTRILPEDADPKEILRLETSFQMGADSKVDYNPIEKYLHAQVMVDKGFQYKEIATYMGIDGGEKEVRNMLKVLKLMDEYLAMYDYEGIYTRLHRGCEDDFLKLQASIDKIECNKIPWITSAEKASVINDLKTICFDFIRLDEKGDFEYRAIAYTKDANFLVDEKTWRAFTEQYFKNTEEIPEEESTADVLSSAVTQKDREQVLNQRDNKWKGNVRAAMMDTFRSSKNKIDDKRQQEKPLSLIDKALNTLSTINTPTLRESEQLETILNKLDQVKTITEEIIDMLKK